jgi:hypothetical protein
VRLYRKKGDEVQLYNAEIVAESLYDLWPYAVMTVAPDGDAICFDPPTARRIVRVTAAELEAGYVLGGIVGNAEFTKAKDAL